MLKWLVGLLASISSVFTTGANKPDIAPPLSMAIIAYQETYYAPVVADLGNFPWAKGVSAPAVAVQPTTVVTPPPAPISTPAPAPAPTPTPAPVSIADTYLVSPEPIVVWYVPVTLRGDSTSDGATRTLPEMTFSREFWRVEVLAYWAPGDSTNPPVENEYFKLEVYEKGTDKLIYTMVSGKENSTHKYQAFKKSGTYYFKVYLKHPSRYEITFTFH